MATLTQLTLNADGQIDNAIRHDAGTGSPFNTHCNDAPDGVSSDYVENNEAEASGFAWFGLTDVDSDFGSMDSLNIDVDVWAETPVSNDSITLTARIFASNNDTGIPLTAESANIGTHADTTRIQRNIVFGTLAGTKAQWNAAFIRFTWTYNKASGPDNANLRLYGVDIDGTYTVGGGDVTVTPDSVALALTAAVPTITKGVVTTTPDVIAMAFAAAVPTIVKGVVTTTPDPVALALVTAVPTITKGEVTTTPDAVALALTAATPVAVNTNTLTPSPIAMALSAVAPTIVKGTVTVTPDPIAMALSALVPGVTNGNTITPDAVILVSSIAAPTIKLTQYPDTVSMALTAAVPTVANGAIIITPDPIAMAFAAPDLTITKGVVTITPDPAVLAGSAVAPTITKGPITITPGTIAMAFSTSTPVVANGNFITPDAVSMTATILDPAISGVLILTPDAVTMASSVVNPTVTKGVVTITPAPATFTLSVPTITAGAPPYIEPEIPMSINDPQYPATVFDGVGPNRTLRTQNSAPDFEDYDQLVAEVIAMQQQQLDDREFTAINDSGGALVPGDIVYIVAADGKLKLADADGASALRIPAGIVRIGSANGAVATVQFAGRLVLTTVQWDAVGLSSAGLVVGASYYLADVPGELTATAPATATDTLFKIGTAISVTTLLVRLDDEGLTV